MTNGRLDVWEEIERTAPSGPDETAVLTEKLVLEVEKLAVELLQSQSMPEKLRDILNRVRIEAVNLTRSRGDKLFPPMLSGRIQGWSDGAASGTLFNMLTSEVSQFVWELQQHPTYRSIEFQCIADFDKCKASRGNHNVLCALAFFICIARRIIPFIRS
jgi:hypothetical protein